MSAGAYFPWIAFDQSIYNACTEEWPESLSLACKRGTPILIDANGRVDDCGASPNPIYGVALEDGHNGTAGQYQIRIARLRVNDKWIIPVLEAMAQNMFGLAGGDLGILKDATTSFWYGSTNDAGAQCRVTDYIKGTTPPGFTIGDTKWAGIVQFHSTKLQVL